MIDEDLLFAVLEKDDPFVELGEKGMEAFSEAEGFFLVNAIPWLKYLPGWLPGMGFKKIARDGYQHSMAMYKKPHEMTKQKLVRPCLVITAAWLERKSI